MSAAVAALRVAVAGNPNAGKTTLFNALTGARAHVANYPGVTIEKHVASTRLPSGRLAHVLDLPGCYSLTARSAEEEVAHEVLIGRTGEHIDRVVCVVDATQLGRGLYLVEQLRELGVPLVVALNMIDLARAQGVEIDLPALRQRLGLTVVPTAARAGEGIEALRGALEAELEPPAAVALQLEPDEERVLAEVRHALAQAQQPSSPGEALWWLTSDLRHAKVGVSDLDDALFARVAAARRELDPQGSGAFNRRVIERRFARVDRCLDGAVHRIARSSPTFTDQADRVLLHPVWGMVIFVAAMLVLFQAVFAWAEPMIGAVEGGIAWLSDLIAAHVAPGLLQSLLVNGVVAGIGNILVFLPQIALLFLGITLMEESGYMARAAFLLDSLMRKVGLHGKAFVPLMSSFACAVPGVMAARTVESTRDRLVTILVAPFMSCSARLPVYTLVVAAVFASAPPVWGVVSIGGLVVTAMYLLGFVAAISVASLLKRTVLRAPDPPFLLELPTYKRPLPRLVVRQVLARCRVFVTQTGTIILAISLLLWGLLTFPRVDAPAATTPLTAAELAPQVVGADPDVDAPARSAQALEHSFGGRLGHLIEPLIAPLGFDWRIGIGLIASFAAREVLVSTLGQVYALGGDIDADSPALRDALLRDLDPRTGRPRFTPLVGLSLLVFFVLAMQCMSTFATVKRETNSLRWPLIQLVGMNTLAYLGSLTVFQVGRALGFE